LNYPYTGRDLFAEPESYAYAKCDGADFLNEWQESRRDAMDALAIRARERQIEDRTERDAPPVDAIKLQSLLHEKPICIVLLEPWIVKFEVFGRLFAWYRDDGRRHPDSPTASLATYILFAERLCETAEEFGSLKHLSILLKVCDALASQPATTFQVDEAANLIALLNREALLVANIAETE